VKGKFCSGDFFEIIEVFFEQTFCIMETSSIAISELSLTPRTPTKATWNIRKKVFTKIALKKHSKQLQTVNSSHEKVWLVV